jgi:hypothetical protein
MIFAILSDQALAPYGGGGLEYPASGQLAEHLPIRPFGSESAAPLRSATGRVFIQVRERIAVRIGLPSHHVELLRDTLPFLGRHVASLATNAREHKLSMGQTL